MTDDQLLALYLERDDLLPEARFALLAELQKRSLTESDAAALAKHMAAVESGRKSGEAPGEIDQDSDTGAPEWEAATESQEADKDGVKRRPLEIVFGSADASEAQVVQGLLESNGFEVTIQRVDLGGAADLGGIQLLVAAEQADQARRLIAQSRPAVHEAAVETETPQEAAQNNGTGVPDKYRTFWRRFFANWIDTLVLGFIEKGTDAWPLFISMWVDTVYSVAMLAVWGQTVGKIICKITVLDVSEKPITFRHAIMRNIVEIVLKLSFLVSFLKNNNNSTRFAFVILYFGLVWFLLELLTMLTNKKRRAIHDFIAGTVVCKTYA